MADDDYAIVIGIQNYPGIADVPMHGHDLQGPTNDARAIHAWLTDPQKGAVPAKNATLITSPSPLPPSFDVSTAQPVSATIVDAFTRIANRGQGVALPLGRRLYVYGSGHGFAVERAKGALFSAEATDLATQHIYATAWLDWFFYAGYFEELVLWLDCCMTHHFTFVPMPPSLVKVMSANAANTRVFTAYSAMFGRQSAEGMMPDGYVHGAFTYTLLQALESAVDPAGYITTATVKQYLINRMKSNVPDAYKSLDSVATEPDFGFDQHMVFRCGVDAPMVTVELAAFPDGTAIDVYGGSNTKITGGVVAGGKVQLRLLPGFYMARAGDRTELFTV